MDPLILKYIHILSATLLFGTGLGTAFHGWTAGLSGDVRAMAVVNRNVVLADWLFTAPAVIVQPVSGVWLAVERGYPLTEGWILWSLALYALVGACWLPVVWLQMRMRHLAVAARDSGQPLPPAYYRTARWWFLLGWPAFAGVLAIVWLMVFRPTL